MKTLNFSLHNNSNTKSILQKLQEMGFEEIEIDEKSCLTFVEIKTNNFLAFISSFLFEDGSIHYGLKIFHYDNDLNEIKIKFGDIDTINRLL